MQLPFLDDVSGKNILLVGCGGGYDIYTGIPIYFSLKKRGCNVYWANYSFTNDLRQGTKFDSITYIVSASTSSINNENYFPEKYLCDWFWDYHNQEIQIYCYTKPGVVPLTNTFRNIVKQHNIDTIMCLDGGTDALMFGDEEDLATPVEDSISLTAISQITGDNIVNKVNKYLLCIGFGIDPVSHYRFLENVSKMMASGGYYGVFSLIADSDEFRQYRSAVNYSNSRTNRASKINNFICDATEGNFGDFHSLQETKTQAIFINPLMSIYWCFNLDLVIDQNINKQQLINSRDFGSAARIIFNNNTAARKTIKIPYIDSDKL